MSQKQAKKFRKEVKKRVDANFGVGMQALSSITRKRPKQIPKRIWAILYIPLFPKKYRKLLIKHLP